MSLKNFVVKNGLTVGTANIDAATGNLFTGNANLGNLATANFFNGVFVTASNAQPNITSVGTLTGLTVNGVSNFGANGNVIITGGTNGQFLSTNGSGNLSWTTIVTSGVSNGTSNISIPVASGNVNTSVGGQANVFVVTSTGANVAGTFNASGNANAANIGTGGLIVATGNIDGGNLNTAGVLSVTGNANVGNLGTAGLVVATGNVTGGNLNTAGVIIATGNVTGGNVNTAGKVVASALESNVTTGTAPIVVASTTKVTNLNADLLDGYDTDTAATANTVVVRNSDGNITGNNISGTLSTQAQPNITSVGTLSSLDVTGNITTSANIVTDLIVGKTSGILISAAGVDQDIELKPTGNGVVDVWSKLISNVATPIAATDAATKGYVDSVAEGLHVHASVQAATPNTLAVLSGGTVSYNNGTAGVGATLTTTGAYATIDGVNIATVGTRILVKDEANAAHNGIYVFTSSTVLTRADDYNTAAEIQAGDFTFVSGGTLYNSTGWVQEDAVTTVGTDPIVWIQFSGAGTFTAGTGLTLTGTVFSITNTAVTAGAYGNGDAVATFTVNQQGQLTAAANTFITANAANLTGTTLNASIVTSSLTSVGTLGSLAVTGNATAGNVYANSGTVGASLLTGTLTTAAQPNVTSVGSLSSLNVTGNANVGNLGSGGLIVAIGNIDGGNLNTGGVLSVTGNANVGNLGTAGLITATGNVSGGNLTTAGAVVATGNVTGGNLTTAGVLSVTGNANVGNLGAAAGVFTANVSAGNLSTSGVLSVTGNANVGNLGTAGLIVATGNIDGGNLNTGGVLAVTGNANVGNLGTGGLITATGNITGGNLTTAGALSVTGNANVGNIGAAAGVFTTVAGSLTTASQPNVTSLGTLTGLGVNGTITGVNITANTGVFTGNAAGLTNIPSGNISGQVANALVAGTVYTNAQPNITSVGTLTTVSTSGNAVIGGNVKVQVGITSNRSNVSVPGTNTATVIDQFNPSDWRTAKYVISTSGADGYQSVEALLVHDGVDSYITIYGSICSNNTADIINLTSNINGVSGNVAVYAASNSASCVVNLVSSYIKT